MIELPCDSAIAISRTLSKGNDNINSKKFVLRAHSSKEVKYGNNISVHWYIKKEVMKGRSKKDNWKTMFRRYKPGMQR